MSLCCLCHTTIWTDEGHGGTSLNTDRGGKMERLTGEQERVKYSHTGTDGHKNDLVSNTHSRNALI